jgi:hypothetical protein
VLDVFFTIDVEIWCDGWNDIDAKFNDCFNRYVYGPTSRGNFGLPYTLAVLDEFGLPGILFVEPLFSCRFGQHPLAEIVGLIDQRRHQVQLHLHTEWVDESREPLLDAVPPKKGKRQFVRDFSIDEQTSLIAAGKRLLAAAGADRVSAFRAGSFGFNRDTLVALKRNGIAFDSSYNGSMFGPDSGVMEGTIVTDIVECEGVYEYPMTVFSDGTGSLRPAQVTACSFPEFEGLLWKALDEGRRSFVILSHNFELLNVARTRPDDVVIARFRKLCSFLDRHRNSFRVRVFDELPAVSGASPPEPLESPRWKTAGRIVEQAYRRRFG